MTARTLSGLDRQIIQCRRCPRLVSWREEVAATKRAAYADEEYWGRPVPGFGSASALIWIVGLAPAAHGANRTGRMFTGDRSGDWLFGALHRVGLAAQPESRARDDGQRLDAVRITAAVHCAPPGNRPTPEEFAACGAWLGTETQIVLRTVRVVVALGGLAWAAALGALAGAGVAVPRPRPRFGHGAEVDLLTVGGLTVGGATVGGPTVDGATVDGAGLTLLGCYHPSQQNTFTGRLTEPMIDAVLGRAAALALP